MESIYRRALYQAELEWRIQLMYWRPDGRQPHALRAMEHAHKAICWLDRKLGR